MKRSILCSFVAGVGLAASGLFLAPTASAYPVGPWGVEGPCAGKAPAECPMSPSEDGLTWAWHGDGWNYDKTGAFVCMSSTIWCRPVMVAVRALPPTPIGSWINPG
ncbi:hypothetical protein [Nocardia cyriacigeorgica]|uniref:hypothetical protein n=1 Tax=Nocardia cyriacigeorgica TaxID=135487 RepID=UPI001BB25DD6|nr:hypothetical protein [Nocardia cyriacigeorgica]